MFAVGQKKYTYIYNNVGSEMHCLKSMNNVTGMEFLRNHFLLVTGNEFGFLEYLDTSTGLNISKVATRMGYCQTIKQNKQNGVVGMGHVNGVVSMWCPKMETPNVKMLCHRGRVFDIAFDDSGKYMASCGADGKLKIYDLRKLECMFEYNCARQFTGNIEFSQKGILATSYGSEITLWKDLFIQKQEHPYMTHILDSKNKCNSLKFCPYEDVLGIGHSNGISSIIIPGSGEANFDSLEANIYETKPQRREKEVMMLLDKLQPETICMDDNVLASVSDKLETNVKIDFSKLKVKKKKKSKLNTTVRKQIVKERAIKDQQKKSALIRSRHQ